MGTPVRLPDKYKGRCAQQKEHTMNFELLSNRELVELMKARLEILGTNSEPVNYPNEAKMNVMRVEMLWDELKRRWLPKEPMGPGGVKHG